MTTQQPAATAATPSPAEATGQPALTYQPHVDVCDCGGEVRLYCDVPGARAESIDVAFEDGVLTIHAKIPARPLPGRPVVQEYGIGDYRRSFRLGEGFDASQIQAEYRRGVLTVHVPRLAAVRPRKVDVRTA
jgi:HSP20 family molecular chaperone IbpA